MAALRVCWISEVQNNFARRALLLASAPLFVAFNITMATLTYAVAISKTVLISYPRALYRGLRIVAVSARLRWATAKPKGSDDLIADEIRERNGYVWQVATWNLVVRKTPTGPQA